MNHQRFGWREDDRPEPGRYGRHRYARGDSGSDRYRGSGRDDEGYGRERDEYGRFQSQDRYGRGGWSDEDWDSGYGGSRSYRMNEGYRGGFERERDSMGRFTGDGRGWNAREHERDNMGRFTGYGGSQRGYGSWERERDSMGRFTSSEYGDHGRSSYGNGREQDRDNMGRFTSGSGRRSMGPHTGRGPKNYQRSEERIKEDVSDKLEDDGQIDASEIEVQVKNGIVTLTGTVESRHEKHLAEQIVEDCPGVKDVLNQLRVQSQSQHGQQSHAHQSSQSGSQTAQQSRKSA